MRSSILLGVIALLQSFPATYQTEAVDQQHDCYITDPWFRDWIVVEDNSLDLRIHQLELGHEYTLHWSVVDPEIEFSYSWSDVEMRVLAHNRRTLQFVPTSSTVHLQFDYDDTSSEIDELGISLSDQTYIPKRKKKGDGPLRLVPGDITTGIPIEELITETFINASCFDIQNIIFNGDAARGLARFENAADLFGFDEGFMMSTFDAPAVAGANFSTNDTGGPADDIAGGSDSDLSLISGNVILDAQVVTFTFTPTVDQISFNYVFGSEEYCDYVGAVNDAFGFFISGPGFAGPYENGAENIALIPGTTDPVTINSVNWTSNPEFYISNVPVTQVQIPGTLGCTQEEQDAPPAAPGDIILDGYTTTLRAVADVVPCEEYTIKLAIGDAFDFQFGSAVFLEANSFFIGDNIDFEVVTNSEDGMTVLENCSDDEACIIFTRETEGAENEVKIPIDVEPSSQATEGADFAMLPDTIIFPPGETEIEFCLTVLSDDILEDIETAILRISNVCPCEDPLVMIDIRDLPPLTAEIVGDSTVCEGDDLDMEVVITDGSGDYMYNWSTGDTDPMITVNPTSDITYMVTITDRCDQSLILDRDVEIVTAPSATLVGEVILCESDTDCDSLQVEFTGNGPWEITYNRDGVQTTVTDITESPYHVFVCVPGIYTLTDVSDRGCPGDAMGEITVERLDVSVQLDSLTVACFGDSTGAIDLTVIEGVAPFTYLWEPGGENTEDLAGLAVGTYSVTVTDANGCSTSEVVNVEREDPITLTLDGFTPVGCEGPNSGSIEITISGGVEPYSYDWSDPAPDVEDPSGIPAAIYSLTVTDANGCQQIFADLELPADPDVPMAEAGSDTTLTCDRLVIDIVGSGSAPDGPPVVLWTTADGNIISDPSVFTITIDQAGVYYLEVGTSDGACSDIDSVIVTLDQDSPSLDIIDDSPVITCNLAELSLMADADSSLLFEWTTADGNITGPSDEQSAVVTLAGTYIVTAIDAATGCSSRDSIAVSADTTRPSLSTDVPDPITCAQTSVWIYSNYDASEDLVINWSTIDGNILTSPTEDSIRVDSAGLYSVTLTDTTTGCSAIRTIDVTDDRDFFEVLIADPEDLTCGRTAVILDGSASAYDADLEAIWLDQDGDTIQISDSLLLTVTEPGDYTLTLRHMTTGCVSSRTVTVLLDDDLPGAEVSFSDTLSCSQLTSIVRAEVTELTDSLEYNWTTSDGGISGAADDSQIVVSSPGTYVVVVSNTLTGCASTDSVTVLADTDVPQFDFDQLPSIGCDPLTTDISITLTTDASNLIYEWSTVSGVITTGGAGTQITAGGLGWYVITVTDVDLGCVAIDSIEVTDARVFPDIVIPDTAVIGCAEPLIILDATGSSTAAQYAFAWSTDADNITTDTTGLQIRVDAPGLYVFTATDTDNGCMTRDTTTVIADTSAPVIIISLRDTLTCEVVEVSIDASASTGLDLSYIWTTADGVIEDGANSPVVQVSEPGTYSLTITDSVNGCSTTSTASVAADRLAPLATGRLSDTLSCLTESIFLSGVGSATGTQFTYLWTGPPGGVVDGETSLEPEISDIGEYTLTVTDTDNGCTSSVTVTVVADTESPVAIIAGDGMVNCATPMTLLDGSSSTIESGFDVVWSLNDAPVATDVSTLTVDEAGVYILMITNLDNGCIDSDTITVAVDTVAPLLVLTGIDTLTCAQSMISADATSSILSATTSITWTLGGSTLAEDTQALDITEPGSYSIVATDTVNGCTDMIEFIVIQDSTDPIVDIGIPDVITCDRSQVILRPTAIMPQWSYRWTTVDGSIVSGATSPDVTVDGPGNYMMIVTDLDNGCTTERSVLVIDDIVQPQISIAEPAVLTCDLEQVTLDATASDDGPDFTYVWTTIDGTIDALGDGRSITVSGAGAYELTVRDTMTGCFATRIINVDEQRTDPSAQFRVTQPGCEDSTGAVTWTIQEGVAPVVASIDGVNFTDVIQFSALRPGDYTVILRDATGCDVEEDFTISPIPITQLTTLDEAITVRLGDSYQVDLEVISGEEFIVSYEWSPEEGLSCTDCLQPLITPLISQTYLLQITTSAGCVEDRLVRIIVDNTPRIYIPTVFTPNDDGINDVFTVYADEGQAARVLNLSVYDRWGNLVHRAENFAPGSMEHGWDGTYKSEKVNPAVFIYRAEIELISGLIVQRAGDVTVVR